MDIDLEAILQTYVAESEEHLTKMEEALVGLESDPHDDKLLEAIFRGAHTIKGNSSSMGYPKVAGFAHVFEEVLQRFRSRTVAVNKNRISLLLASVDALHQMIPEAISGKEELRPEHVALLQRLARVDENDKPPESAAEHDVKPQRSQPFGRRKEDIKAWAERTGTIRIDTQKLDRMLDLAGELAIAQGRLRQNIDVRSQPGDEILEAQDQVERLSMDLQEQIMRIRMVPVGPIFRQYIRTVRDIAQAQGKSARLALAGEEVEVDMSIIEHLKDPLTHMIRNSLDHGIETSTIRESHGKDPCGQLTLTAAHEGSSIVIRIQDDGAGLQRDKILARAKTLGIMKEHEQISEQELFQLIFEPGFSTADRVSALSGRGVGMDIVRRNIEALRGTVSVDSEPGHSTTITIRLPLTLAIIEGFAVSLGDDTYVFPLHTVLECLELPTNQRSEITSQGVIDLRGEPLPYIRLRDWFGLDCKVPARESIVVIETDGWRAGIVVDSLIGTRQTVIKPLNNTLADLPGIAGSTILGNGRVAIILDVPGLMREVLRAQNHDSSWSGHTNATSSNSQQPSH